MSLLRSLRPRDPAAAARSAATLAAASLAVTLFFIVVTPRAGFDVHLRSWLSAAGLAAIVVFFRRVPQRWVTRTALVVPLVGLVGDAVLAYSAHDASAAQQVSLALPVLYAASQIRPLGAALVVVLAAIEEAVVTHAFLPQGVASKDALFVTAALVSTSALLIRAGQRQDRLVARLCDAAATDTLTGLCTRRSFDEAAIAALDAAVHEPVALLLVDVDAFKAVNDTWGHPVGDDALVHIAGCLRAVLGNDPVIGRLGGDEFAAVLHPCTQTEARALAAAMSQAVAAAPLVLAGGQRLGLSVSVGVAHVAAASLSLREVYADADSDLYRAKHARIAAPDHVAAPTTEHGRREHRDAASRVG